MGRKLTIFCTNSDGKKIELKWKKEKFWSQYLQEGNDKIRESIKDWFCAVPIGRDTRIGSGTVEENSLKKLNGDRVDKLENIRWKTMFQGYLKMVVQYT